MLAADLCIAGLVAESSDAVVHAIAPLMLAKGCIRASFAMAAITRERRSPTGLPFPGLSIAMPHAEPEHVIAPAIAVASLASPVTFRQMGSPAVKLAVSLIVMPALTVKEQAAAELSRLIQLLQDEELRRALVSSSNSAAMYETLAPHFRR